MRIIPPATSGSPGESRRCALNGCGLSTRDGKPFCPEHVEEAAYPKRILAELSCREDEEGRLLKNEDIPLDGHLVRETLRTLNWSALTERRLGRTLDVPHRAVERLVIQLEREGIVRKRKTPRGSIIVEGVEPEKKPSK